MLLVCEKSVDNPCPGLEQVALFRVHQKLSNFCPSGILSLYSLENSAKELKYIVNKYLLDLSTVSYNHKSLYKEKIINSKDKDGIASPLFKVSFMLSCNLQSVTILKKAIFGR